MNKYQHAEQSAKIFGGKATTYLPIHEIIDLNKVVTSSIFGRFFMHHYDVGGSILEKIFGEEVADSGVFVKDILIQHLIEDYDMVPTFEKDWLPSFSPFEKGFNLKLLSFDTFLKRVESDKRLCSLNAGQIKEVDDFFHLNTLSTSSNVVNSEWAVAVLGNALGADLIPRILGEKWHGQWTSDIVTGYLHNRFFSRDNDRGMTPMLADYVKYVNKKDWMYPPNGDDRLDPKKVLDKIEKFKLGTLPSRNKSMQIGRVPSIMQLPKVEESISNKKTGFPYKSRSHIGKGNLD